MLDVYVEPICQNSKPFYSHFVEVIIKCAKLHHLESGDALPFKFIVDARRRK